MGAVSFQSLDIATPLGAAPIQADFVRAGQPEASNVILARSTDRSSYTMVWHCTAGAFEWTYDCDETIVILEGSVLLTDTGNAPRRLRAGDAVFFPKGAKVFWEIDASVRKLAIMHDQLPAPLSGLMKLLRRGRSMATVLAARLQAPSLPRPAVLAVARNEAACPEQAPA